MSQNQPMLRGNVAIGQSGGPTMVINQSLVGIVETLRGQPGLDHIFGALYGVAGIVDNRFVDLHDIPQDRLERIAQTPSAALGSTRVKPDAEYCQRIFEQFAKHNIRYFFYIGGNDSSHTCHIVNELAKEAGYDLHSFHVPKTIDNDLVLNDHTPGFPSAAKFVAQAFTGDNLDNRALPGIKINVVMGRDAGFLTASSVLARTSHDDGPHLIYVPEVTFDEEKFTADVERIYARLGRCLIAVSEGIRAADGKPVITKLAEDVQVDEHGNQQYSGTGALGDFLIRAIRQRMGKDTRVRADTFGYLQRCYAGVVSKIDQEEARMVGRQAAQAALDGRHDGSVTIKRVSHDPYRVEYRLVDLSDVAGKTTHLDRQFIVDDNNINDSFINYLKPLVGPLPVVELLRFKEVEEPANLPA